MLPPLVLGMAMDGRSQDEQFPIPGGQLSRQQLAGEWQPPAEQSWMADQSGEDVGCGCVGDIHPAQQLACLLVLLGVRKGRDPRPRSARHVEHATSVWDQDCDMIADN